MANYCRAVTKSPRGTALNAQGWTDTLYLNGRVDSIVDAQRWTDSLYLLCGRRHRRVLVDNLTNETFKVP
jgi:hypothetical protein